MKRLNNLYQKIISPENLRLADQKARKGKGFQYGIQVHDKNREANILMLHGMLNDKTYRTSDYTTFMVKDPKEREVFRLPYFPDRIAHHAIMNILEPIFVATFTKDTYSCIKKRGIHAASYALGIAPPESLAMEGPKIDVDKLFGRKIIVHDFTISPSKKIPGTELLTLQIELDKTKRVVFCSSKYLMQMIKKIPHPEGFPFETTIVKKDNDSHQFT